MAENQLAYKIVLEGTIIAESGLLIGGSGSSYTIGGTDKQVVRNPVTKLPYIPGSSLKGKMRSLFELMNGTIENGGPTQNPRDKAAQLFGHIKSRTPAVQEYSKANNLQDQQPSRIIVRDCELVNPEDLGNTELLYTEVKAENTIDRLTAAANPRFFERVPKGAEFKLEIIINVFKSDENKEFLNWACQALRLVQDDYLGGGGSRGNGQISINITKAEKRAANYYSQTDSQSEPLLASIPDSLKNKSNSSLSS